MNFESFTSVSEILGHKGTGRGRQIAADVLISTDVGGRRSVTGEVRYTLRFSLAHALIKRARFMPGDRVDVLLDKATGMVLIKRVKTGGWALSFRSNSKERAMVQISWEPGLPSVAKSTECTDIKVVDEGIVFRLPACVSFEKNARLQADLLSGQVLTIQRAQRRK